MARPRGAGAVHGPCPGALAGPRDEENRAEENVQPPQDAETEQPPEPITEQAPESSPFSRDPISQLAEAAGYSDSERWWEHHVELRGNEEGIFEAVLDAMGALRELNVQTLEPFEAQREASMREAIRKAQKDGFEKIAVVCRAWHAPALLGPEQCKIRQSPAQRPAKSQSGHDLGALDPRQAGFQQRLWGRGGVSRLVFPPVAQPRDATVSWLVRVAQLLRSKDLDASSASVIEAVRLAETLTSLTHRKVPGLPELMDAIRAVMCFGDNTMVQVIHRELILGEELEPFPPKCPVPLLPGTCRPCKNA